jgi:serine-type D-Ala-D-Ala carboxypeptidase (penicillin-binding protein 5/6)
MKYTLLFLALIFPALAHAKLQTDDGNTEPAETIQDRAPILSAKSYLLYDFTSNQILLEQNSHQRIEPASLTKLMTAYIVFSSLKQHKLAPEQKIYPSGRHCISSATKHACILSIKRV